MSHHRKPVKPLPPSEKVYLRSDTLKEDAETSRLLRAICKQPFVSQLDLHTSGIAQATEGVATLPVELQDSFLADYTFQYARLDASRLLSAAFMNTYVRVGSLIALSCTSIDGNVLAIDGAGRLCLSLHKHTYEQLGLMGNVSRYGKGRLRYFVTIDLRLPHMRDGKPGYEKTKQSLAKLGEMDIMFAFMNEFSFPSAVTFPEGIASRTYRLRVESAASTTVPVDHAQHLRKMLARQANNKRKSGASGLADAKMQAMAFAAVNGEVVAQSTSSVNLHGFIHPGLVKGVFEHLHRQQKPFTMAGHIFPEAPVLRSCVRGSNNKKRPPTNDERNIESSTIDGWILSVFRSMRHEQNVDETMREAEEQTDVSPHSEYILYETQ